MTFGGIDYTLKDKVRYSSDWRFVYGLKFFIQSRSDQTKFSKCL